MRGTQQLFVVCVSGQSDFFTIFFLISIQNSQEVYFFLSSLGMVLGSLEELESRWGEGCLSFRFVPAVSGR